ncbi:MAG: hypothetical protein ACKPAH_06640, partial [Verrucomicrobiota bacterium]
MNRSTLLFLALAVWLSAFAQTQFAALREWMSVPVAVGTSLVCYAALPQSPRAAIGLAPLCGLLSSAL